MEIVNKFDFGVTYKLDNESCYSTDEYGIYLDGKLYGTSNKNENSIFGLKPNTRYKLKINGVEKSFKTCDIKYLINVRDYNATGDGITDDTSAINLAIYTAPEESTIIIPKGVYMVDQILLKSNLNIYLEKGAVLRQNTSRKKLAILKAYQKNYHHTKAKINASWEGNPLDSFCSLIYGKDVELTFIYGDGVLDGNGSEGDFWQNPKVKNMAYRPKNVLLVNCDSVFLYGFSSINSASWNMHLLYCNDISISGLTIESDVNSPNTDGINPEGCTFVHIGGCHFKVGDDCIAIKSGKYFMSANSYPPSSNIEIENCLMENGHGGVVIGSEMSCGVKNVEVKQCIFRNTDRGLRIKTRRGRGKDAVVDGVKFSNVEMDGVKFCFVVNMYYNCDPDGKSDYVRCKEFREKDDFTPSIKNISLDNVRAKNTTGCAVFIYGLPESIVENVEIKNSIFEFANDRVLECPAMMCDFDVTEPLDFYYKNVEGDFANV